MTTAWLFAGHGVQYPGMCSALLNDHAGGKRWINSAESISGAPLGKISEESCAEGLTEPVIVESLLAAVSCANVDRLRSHGLTPTAVAAYSAGHVAALYAAGVIDQEACLKIALHRGEALSDALTALKGGMISVSGLSQDVIRKIAGERNLDIWIAAENGPRHLSVSGKLPELAIFSKYARSQGANIHYLAVAGPWHTPELKDCANNIAERINNIEFKQARIPVWSSVTSASTSDPDELRHLLAISVCESVEWLATIQSMYQYGINDFIEVSPGKFLYSLLSTIDSPPELQRHYIQSPRDRMQSGENLRNRSLFKSGIIKGRYK